MVSLIIQTVLLVAIAFILGAVIGCLLRSLFGAAESSADTAAATTGTSSGSAIAAGAAGMGAVGAVSLASTKDAPASAGTAPSAAPAVPAPPMPTAPVKPAEKPELSVPRAPTATVTPPTPLVSATPAAKSAAKPSAAAPKKAAPKKAEPKAGGKAPARKTKLSAKAAPTTAIAAAAVPDNLKEIRGIGPQNEGRLNSLGVNSFAQIASWKRKDEAQYGEALSFPGRIEREDWVGQAKILAKGGDTAFSKRVSAGTVASSAGKANAGDMGKKPKTLLTAPRGGTADNLTLIDGVGNAIEKKMFKLGIYHFDQVAKMTKAELVWLGNSVGFPGRPERENWAGESKVLGAGGTTEHANRVERGQIKTSRKSTKDEK